MPDRPNHRETLRELVRAGRLTEAFAFLEAHPLAGGADEQPQPLYPAIPDDVSALSDEELEQLENETIDIVRRVQARDAELIGDRDAQDVISQTQAAVEGVERIRAQRATIAEESANLEAELDDAISRILEPAASDTPDETPVAEADTDEPAETPLEEGADAAGAPEAVAASARRRPLPVRRPRQHEPRPAAGRREAPIIAAADLPGHPSGSQLPDLRAVAAAMIARHRSMGPSTARDKVLIASIQQPLPEERTLRVGQDEANAAKIEAVASPQAIRAAGGICVMPEPLYDVPTFGVDDTPVVDSLPTFNADRGGISFYPPVGFGEINTAVGVITNAEASAGGTNALKTCQTITCPPIVTAFVDSVYRCIEVGNLSAITFPERVEAFTRNVMVAWAQARELEALAAIDAASTAVTYTLGAGAMSTLLGGLGLQAASMRSRQRLAPDTTLRVILPSWSADMLVQDLVRQGFDPDRYGVGRDGVVNAVRQLLNLNITFTLDSQVFGAQSAGPSLTWPATMITRMFPEGSFLHLNTGNLDLGLVRDSGLNQRNAYQIFSETFETNVFRGVESRKITITLAPTGQTGVNASATLTANS